MDMKNMEIRKAVFQDLPEILEIYAYARAFMAKNGNGTQWGTTHPTEEMLCGDIEKGQLYVMETGHGLCGVFAFILGEDPTYGYIEGQWESSTPYGTIHRIAGNGTEQGILQECTAFCLKRIRHLRIDTHKNNRIMRNAIMKNGFTYRGIIYLENGDPRLAYERI